MKFRAQAFYDAVAETRIKTIFEPRWQLIKQVLQNLQLPLPIPNVLEIGASVGLFATVALQSGDVLAFDAIEPSAAAAERLRNLGLRHVYVGMETEFTGVIEPIYDVIFCNGVLEHPFDPAEFIQNLKQFLKPDGVLVLCSSGASGIDSLLLQQEMPNAFPPHVQNFISDQGIQALSDRCGLRLREFRSIGQLDLDIIYHHLLKQTTEPSEPAIAAVLVKLLDHAQLRADLQAVLQKHHLTGFFLAVLSTSEEL
ncbi:hypothetical protein DO97_10815 [Neosynechococcus sphagnicola sy1]|uniref:Methyltransferase type 11 domain-containing protein n=1 Tax=Neosynechococcus sphagnicola sy1 TaxID=1497020 RepID=A0A098TJG9_9CYAN|nr:class I SAM-dependent methyltransferase [Neosynechococcus sphagnicola]KGF72291.1 hypothetical protein DO97_10815 [Neosynechococcus sphagnicola sy1]